MAEDAERILSLQLPCEPAAPAAVRAALAEMEWLGWVLGDVMLVASELVTNAVSHSGGRRQHVLEVSLQTVPGGLRVAVRDPGISGRSARPREADAQAAGGWGLLIVEQLAARWGEERGDGYLVWAEVALPPEAAPARLVAAAPPPPSRTATRE